MDLPWLISLFLLKVNMYIHSSYCILIAALATSAYGFEYRFDDTLRSSPASPAADGKPNLTAAQVLGSDDNYCLVFEDHFNTFDLKNWQHEISLSGGKYHGINKATDERVLMSMFARW